jgi:hypothetical protein
MVIGGWCMGKVRATDWMITGRLEKVVFEREVVKRVLNTQA